MIFRGLPEQIYVFWESTPFFPEYYPYSGRQAQYACIPRRQPEAGGSPLNAVSTVPVGRQVMPGDARKVVLL